MEEVWSYKATVEGWSQEDPTSGGQFWWMLVLKYVQGVTRVAKELTTPTQNYASKRAE